MPKSALFTLKWSEERRLYELYEYEHFLLQADGDSWFAWLTTHTSFSFQGKEGRFNLLKETRKNKGEGYWYAYQRQGKRTIKRYVGRSAELVTTRIEEIGRELQDAPPSSPLLEPKFHLPRLHASLVRRKRLLSLLDTGLKRRLTLLSAPAGSGKTTLVSQWIAERKSHRHFPPVAWLSLEKSDNDPVRFWRYVITACEVFQADLGRAALEQLATTPQSPLETAFLETILTIFLNELARSVRRGILVLEDYHVITSPQIHKTMAFLLDHLPASLHLIVMTRSDPVLPVVRLRAQGELCEVDAHALRFSQEETAAFLQQVSPSLFSAETIQQLDAHLEGWAAGLRLFALSLQGLKTPHTIEQHLANFVSGHRPLQDYFIDEVLNAQPASLQTFLLDTCILSRLTASLCDAVTGWHNSASVLESMERAGLFLERLEGPGQWYRYHALFIDAMRVEARRRLGTERLRTASLQASDWYEQQGMLAEAVEAALQAEEMTRAAEIIERHLATQGFDDMQEFHTVRRWLEQLPGHVLHSRPALCLCYARVLSLSFAPEPPTPTVLTQIEELLHTAEEHWSLEGNTASLGAVFSFHAQNAIWEGEQERAIAHARQALHWLPTEAVHWRGICLNILGTGELLAGQLLQARKTLQEALALWAAVHHPHGARSCTLILGMVYFEQGELHLAAECYRRVVNEARALGDREDLVPALIGLAQLSYEWNDLEAAEQAVQEACELSEQMRGQELMTRAALVLMRIWYVRGQKARVQQRLASLLTQLQARRDLYHEVLLCQIRFLLADGDYSTARRYLNNAALQERGISTTAREQEDLLLASMLIQQGETQIASNVLERLRLAAQEAGRGRILLEVQLLIARVQNVEQRVQDVRQTLQTVLSFAHTEGYLRLFLDQVEAIAVLLRAMQPHVLEEPLASYLQTVLRAFGPTQDIEQQIVALIEPLSRQEQRVLRLLVAELSYPEIARELVVSVNTVKTQVNSIYRKLNVHNRREARAAVLRLQLF